MRNFLGKGLHRAAAWVLALCMCLSLVPAQASAAEDVVLVYEGQPGYVRYGGTLRGEITVTLDPTWFGFGGTTDAVTIGDPTKIAAFNSASLSVAGSDPSVFNPNIDPPRFAWGSIAQGVHECTLYVTMEKVTGDPKITLAPLSNTSTEHYKDDARDWQFVTPAMTVAGGPEVHLVYDLDVTAGANGTVSFDAARYYSGTDKEILDYWQGQGMTLIEATTMLGDGKNIFDRDDASTDHSAGITNTTAATAQWVTGEDLEFTVTPNTNYEVDAVTATLNGTDIPTYFTDNGDGTYTLNLPETAITAATDKVEINATFKGAGQSITSSVEGGNGTISPLGEQSVPYGADQTFTMTPEDKYCVDTVTVNENGESKTHHTTASEIYDAATGTWSYTFKEVKTSGSIVVKYAPDQNGDKIPDNRQAFLTFTADANGAFDAATVPADATGVDKAKSYTIVRNKEKNGVVAADGGYTVVEADIATPVAANGYAFDLWKNGNTNLTVCDPKAPIGQFIEGNTTFTATFAASEDGVIPDKYKMKFIFTLDANSQFADDSGDAQKTATAVKYDDANNPSLTGTATISADMIPAVEGKFGYAFKEWFSTDMTPNTATDLAGKTFQGAGEADEVEIQAVAENAAAILRVVEESDVATGAWNNDETFTFTVQLRIGDKAATENEIKAIKLDKGALYREEANHFPSAASDASEYLTLAAPEFEAGSYQTVMVEDAEYGQMTMTLTKDSLFRSSIVTFTASYDDGVTGSSNNKDTFVTIIPGDVNRNGMIRTNDGISIFRQAADSPSAFSSWRFADELMDVNRNGTIGTNDGILILQMSADVIPTN